uniref:Uncharacterized protein n=1 Tax=Oryza glaberrima TaxID=4538 RepID=I1NRX2_ORYGL
MWVPLIILLFLPLLSLLSHRAAHRGGEVGGGVVMGSGLEEVRCWHLRAVVLAVEGAAGRRLHAAEAELGLAANEGIDEAELRLVEDRVVDNDPTVAGAKAVAPFREERGQPLVERGGDPRGQQPCVVAIPPAARGCLALDLKSMRKTTNNISYMIEKGDLRSKSIKKATTSNSYMMENGYLRSKPMKKLQPVILT